MFNNGVATIKRIKMKQVVYVLFSILLLAGIIGVLFYVNSMKPLSIAQKAAKDFPQYVELFEEHNELINRVNDMLISVYDDIPGNAHIYYEPDNGTIFVTHPSDRNIQPLEDVQHLSEQDKEDVQLFIKLLNPRDYPMWLSPNSYRIVYNNRRAWIEINKFNQQPDNLTPKIIVSNLPLDNNWYLVAVANEDHVY